MRFRPIAAAALLVALPLSTLRADELTIEAKIPLGSVQGRIDHLAIDLGRKRLFVAELGNNSVGVVDLVERKLVKRIAGLKEPQGVGYVPATDTLYVANAGDGSVRLYQGAELLPAARIDLGDDADNIRVDNDAGRVYVGFGRGALAIIDPVARAKIGEIKLKGHPESFQLEPGGAVSIWANVPDAGEVAVLDRNSRKQIASWPLRDTRANFPMAIDATGRRVIVVSRRPARLIAFAAETGAIAARADSCGDSDDVFVDAKRKVIYVVCGEGFIEVFEAGSLQRLGRIRTVPGARTAWFDPELDRLFLAVRASGAEGAAIWVFRTRS